MSCQGLGVCFFLQSAMAVATVGNVLKGPILKALNNSAATDTQL